MRILMITDVYFPRVNGVSTSIRSFRRELRAQGHHVTLIAPAYPVQPADDDQDIIRIPSRYVPRDPEDRMMRRGHINRLLPDLQRQQFDVLHIHTPFIAHYAGVHLARALNLPSVETYHTFFEEYLHHYVPLIPRPLMRLLARRFTVSQCNAVDHVIAPSRAMHQGLKDYGVNTTVSILPTGLEAGQFKLGDGARFRAQHNIPTDRPVLLYVGRVAHEKNIDFLLHSFKKVNERVPETLLLIVGEGPALGHIQALTERLELSNAVRFIGYLNRDTELLDCYRAGDLFVFASRTETQGLVLLEALAQGTPVVSTAHMGTKDVLADTRGTRIVNDDSREFADAAIALLTDKQARLQLAQAAQADAARWSSQHMAERLLTLYSTTIEAQHARRPATVSVHSDPHRSAQ